MPKPFNWPPQPHRTTVRDVTDDAAERFWTSLSDLERAEMLEDSRPSPALVAKVEDAGLALRSENNADARKRFYAPELRAILNREKQVSTDD